MNGWVCYAQGFLLLPQLFSPSKWLTVEFRLPCGRVRRAKSLKGSVVHVDVRAGTSHEIFFGGGETGSGDEEWGRRRK